jgi:hypothetical protein
VLGEGALESRFEALHGSTMIPLIGRDEELELLLRRWQQAAAGEGRVVLLTYGKRERRLQQVYAIRGNSGNRV